MRLKKKNIDFPSAWVPFCLALAIVFWMFAVYTVETHLTVGVAFLAIGYTFVVASVSFLINSKQNKRMDKMNKKLDKILKRLPKKKKS